MTAGRTIFVSGFKPPGPVFFTLFHPCAHNAPWIPNADLWVSRYQFLRRNRKVSYSLTGRVIDCVGYGRGRSGYAYFADPSRSKRIEVSVRNVDGRNINLSDVRVHRNVIIGEVLIHDAARSSIHMRVFVQSQAYAPHYAADELAPGCLFVQHLSYIVDRCHTPHPRWSEIGINGDLREHRAEGMRRK